MGEELGKLKYDVILLDDDDEYGNNREYSCEDGANDENDERNVRNAQLMLKRWESNFRYKAFVLEDARKESEGEALASSF